MSQLPHNVASVTCMNYGTGLLVPLPPTDRVVNTPEAELLFQPRWPAVNPYSWQPKSGTTWFQTMSWSSVYSFIQKQISWHEVTTKFL